MIGIYRRSQDSTPYCGASRAGVLGGIENAEKRHQNLVLQVLKSDILGQSQSCGKSYQETSITV